MFGEKNGGVKIERQWELGLSLDVEKGEKINNNKQSKCGLLSMCVFFFILYSKDQNITSKSKM